MPITPDIVRTENFVTSDILLGWQPLVENEDLEDRQRILSGLITPKEMALQLAFGIYRHALARNETESYDMLFAREARKSRDGIKGFMQHEACYVVALALWHDRDSVLNYPRGYASYSSHYDGCQRTLTFSNPEDLSDELYRNIDDEYISAVQSGHKSSRDIEIAEVKEIVEELRLAGDEETAIELINMYSLDSK